MSRKNVRCLSCFCLIVFLVNGCGFPFPGDKEKIRDSCIMAQTACENTCQSEDGCRSACAGGFNGCIDNVNTDSPKDWQPADAFYDGCKDNCGNDFCENACVGGQNEAARQSAKILKKYGVMTLV